MIYGDWKARYTRILDDFGYDGKEDERSAQTLQAILKAPGYGLSIATESAMEKLLKGQDVIIFGGAVPLVGTFLKRRRVIGKTVIAADGITTTLLKHEIIPDIIVTDLDGKVTDQAIANRNGAIAAIHAHGDNMDAIERFVPFFPGLIAGTTQGKPFGDIHNYGGFTDGDRAVFLAEHFGAQRIALAGFDFEKTYGEPKSKIALKLRKLAWARLLIEERRKNGRTRISYVR